MVKMNQNLDRLIFRSIYAQKYYSSKKFIFDDSPMLICGKYLTFRGGVIYNLQLQFNTQTVASMGNYITTFTVQSTTIIISDKTHHEGWPFTKYKWSINKLIELKLIDKDSEGFHYLSSYHNETWGLKKNVGTI